MKRNLSILFALLLSVLFGTNVSAENKFYAEDVTVEPGGTVTVSVHFDNSDEEITAFNFHMYLPTGLSVVNKSGAYEKSRTNDPGTVDFTITDQGSGKYQVWWQNSDTEEYSIIGNEGILFSFTLQAASDIAEDDYEITFAANEAYNIDLDDIEFTFTPIKVTVGSAAETVAISLANAESYNTYVAEKDLDFTSISAKAEAYIVTAVSATEATLTQVDAVPAGEPILIKCKGSGDLEIAVAATTPTVSGNLLKTTAQQDLADGDYLLAKNGSQFVKWNGEGTLAADKAFLPGSEVPGASGAKPFSIDFGTATGISEVKAAKADGAIYSISGVRVAEAQKGVYIMNGRKVIVK